MRPISLPAVEQAVADCEPDCACAPRVNALPLDGPMTTTLRRLAGIAVVGVLMLACHRQTAASPETPQIKLPSGRTFRSLGVVKINFRNSEPALMLTYVSNARGSGDTETITNEVEEIWPEFQKEVDKAGLHAAIIAASSPPPTSFGFSKGWKFNTVFSKGSDGRWTKVAKP